MIGAASVATAAPDGYTFVVSGVASHVIARHGRQCQL